MKKYGWVGLSTYLTMGGTIWICSYMSFYYGYIDYETVHFLHIDAIRTWYASITFRYRYISISN